MTLRDLTPRELYNLRRRCKKLFKAWARSEAGMVITPSEAWDTAYNAGLKDGLAKGEKKS